MRCCAIALLAFLIPAGATLRAATVTLDTGVEVLFAFGAPGGLPDAIPTFEYLATGPATIRVVDIGYEGDEFKFTVDGVPYFTHIPVPGASDELGSLSFDAAWADPHLSRGIVFVGPGLHTIDIEVIGYSQNTLLSDDGAAFIRADAVPEPGTFLLLAGGAAGLMLARKIQPSEP